MTEVDRSVDDTIMEVSLPRHFRWVWIAGVFVITMAFIVLAAMHQTFPGLIIAFAVALVWILMPLVILLVKMTRKYGFREGMKKLRVGPRIEPNTAVCQTPTEEDKKAFLAAAKSASRVTLDTSNAPEDLCPICLDEEDMGESLITLQCGHIFHEKCIDSVIDTAYDKMYAPNYLGLPILSRDDVLSSLRCPLCRSQMTNINEEQQQHDIEEGHITTTPQSSSPTTTNVEELPSVVYSRPLARVPPTFYLSGERVGDAPPPPAAEVVVAL